MTPVRLALAIAGVALLVLLLMVNLPGSDRYPFSTHMLLHMFLVALLAPALVLAFRDQLNWQPAAGLAVVACGLEFIIVWGWHLPALHHAARQNLWVFIAEQGSFLGTGLLLWGTALGGRRGRPGSGTANLAGLGALFLTGMHMTLLGALLTLAPRVLYRHAVTPPDDALFDQQLGGILMLVIGGLSYLAGSLVLLFRSLQAPSLPDPDRRPS